MTSDKCTVGIDYLCGFYYAVKVQQRGSGPHVTALVRLEKPHLAEYHWLDDAEIILSVPDNEVIVKNLHLNRTGSWDVNLQTQFELSVLMLDGPEEFCFDTVYTGNKNRYLGLITRRQNLEQLSSLLFSEAESPVSSPKYRMRAVALAKGYLNFCHPEEGKFICLADFSDDIVSICFIHEGNIVGLAYLPTDRLDWSSTQGLKKIAVDFMTIVNYKLTSIHGDGVTEPLSALFVSGGSDKAGIRTALERYFSVVTTPKIDTRLFTDPTASDIPLENYLVSLGLTAN